MIEIEEAGWDSPETDGCCNMTYAVLKVNGIVIPLCEDCLKDLEEELKNYRSKIHCYECKHYICSNSGLHYGGSCQLEANENGKQSLVKMLVMILVTILIIHVAREKETNQGQVVLPTC